MKPHPMDTRAARAAFAALTATAALAASPAHAGVDVGVGVTIREPGVYGRIEIGTAPPPPVIYSRPVVIAQPPVVVAPVQPLYLYVPPGHAKKWSKHCHKYDACGRPVYFVKEEWVQARYAESHGGKGPPVHAQSKGKGKGKDRDD